MKLEDLIIFHSENAIICLSADYTVTGFNVFAENMLQLSKRSVLHKNFFSVCCKKNIQLPFDGADLKRKSKKPQFIQDTLLIKNKISTFIEWKVIYDKKTMDNPFFLVLVRSALRIEKTKARNTMFYLKDILENLPEYIYWKDTDFIYQGCNKHVAQYLGLRKPGDIVGKTDYDFNWSIERIKTLHKADAEVVEKKASVISEDKIPTLNGSSRIMLTSKSPLLDEEGKIVGILGVSTDITELKRAKRKLKTTKNKLDAMTVLSSSIAHELRTPFASIELGATGIEELLPSLISTYEIAKKANLAIPKIGNMKFYLLKEMLSDMKFEIRSAFIFIDMLLVKLNPSVSAKSEEIFSIAECVQQVIEKYPFEEKERTLINTVLSDDFKVQGSIVLVSHVFFNLLKNALYYIAASGKGEIFITLEKIKLYNKVHFKDTGAGISQDVLPKIFNRFYSKTYHGTGIGLAFCKSVLKSLQGHISCVSVEGEYTVFTLCFPNIEEQE